MADVAPTAEPVDAERARALPPGVVLAAALAVPVVAYGYLGGLWLSQHGYAPRALVAVREWVNRPLGVGEDFGVLALCVLLVAAGYAGAGRGPLRSAVWAALPAAVAAGAAAAGLSSLVWPFVAVFVAAVLRVAALPLGRWPVAAVASQVAAVAVAVWLVGEHGQEAVDKLAFAVLPIIGQVLWSVRARAFGAVSGGLVAVGGWAVVAAAEPGHPAWEGQWYPVTVCFSVLLVLVALPTGELLGSTPLVRAVAARAAWFVAVLGPVGLSAQDALHPAFPWPLVVLAGVLATAGAAEVGYRAQVLAGAR
jgi:hypothetical protein